jgi:hypothetical protein
VSELQKHCIRSGSSGPGKFSDIVDFTDARETIHQPISPYFYLWLHVALLQVWLTLDILDGNETPARMVQGKAELRLIGHKNSISVLSLAQPLYIQIILQICPNPTYSRSYPHLKTSLGA